MLGAFKADRCKIGAIAIAIDIIIKVEFECEANLGRVVHVRGLRQVSPASGMIWRIKPVVGTTMTYIEHRDDWLLPIRPEDCDGAIDAAHDLPMPRVLEVA